MIDLLLHEFLVKILTSKGPIFYKKQNKTKKPQKTGICNFLVTCISICNHCVFNTYMYKFWWNSKISKVKAQETMFSFMRWNILYENHSKIWSLWKYHIVWYDTMLLLIWIMKVFVCFNVILQYTKQCMF